MRGNQPSHPPHSIVEAIKAAVWLAHGAGARVVAQHAACSITLVVGTKEPPTQVVDGAGGKKRKTYNVSHPVGAAAVQLLTSWGSTASDDMPAPWRQTGGGGGSEFGKPKWFAALKDGFKTTVDPPRFQLWQLALADVVVRHSARACHSVPWPLLTQALSLQADRLVHPTNPKAVATAATMSSVGAGRVGGDTESAVRKWMTKLYDKLQGVSPAPVNIAAESQDGGAPAARIELIIADYVPPTAALGGSA